MLVRFLKYSAILLSSVQISTCFSSELCSRKKSIDATMQASLKPLSLLSSNGGSWLIAQLYIRGNAYSTGACGKTLNGIDLSLRIFSSTCSKAKLSASSIEKLVSLSIPLLLICACSLRKDKRFCVTISSITTAGIYSSLLAAIACNCFRLPRSSEYEFSFLARFVSTITITIISPRTVSS